MTVRQLSHIDRILDSVENGLKTLVSKPVSTRPRPFPIKQKTEGINSLNSDEQKLSASLMRINHTGEICAQALYQGQALTAKLPEVRTEMEAAASEEIDHLAWCNERLNELNSHTSYLNPGFYALSFGIGATAGLISDRVSLGFVAATEEQVCQHLREHQIQLPESDLESRAIVDQMLIDEEKHGYAALEAGGIDFHPSIKKAMTLMSKVMTKTTARF